MSFSPTDDDERLEQKKKLYFAGLDVHFVESGKFAQIRVARGASQPCAAKIQVSRANESSRDREEEKTPGIS